MLVACIPAFNEAAKLEEVVKGVRPYVDRVFVCDDGSTDGTNTIAHRCADVVVSHRTNQGKGAALQSLFIEALNYQPDIVVTIDGDGEHDPKDIPRMVKLVTDGKADIVITERIREPASRRVGYKLYNTVLSTGFNDVGSGLRAFRGSILKYVMPSEKRAGVDGEIFLKAQREGLRIASVPTSIAHGTGLGKGDGLNQAKEVLSSMAKFLIIRRPSLTLCTPGLLLVVVSLFFGFEGYGLSLLGVGAFPYVIRDLLLSLFFLLLGMELFVLGVTVWIVEGAARWA